MSRPPHFSKLVVGAGIAAMTTAVRMAAAEAPPPADSDLPPPVDVVVRETPPPHRAFSVEWNPLSLFIDRFSVNVVIVPGNHHGLVLSPFYTWTGTAEYATNLDSQGNQLVNANGSPYTLNVPRQTFHGFGGEIGYRYYLAQGGPRGFFAGPSLILAALQAKAYNGSTTGFGDIGIAADVGYEALVADRVSISAGAGVQYTFTTQDIPPQQIPASIYANERFYPRLLLSLGYAF
jgi:hypothetical protein